MTIIRVSDGCQWCGCDGCPGCSRHPWRECTCSEFEKKLQRARLTTLDELIRVRLPPEIADDQT